MKGFTSYNSHILSEGHMEDDRFEYYIEIVKSLPNKKLNRLFIVPDEFEPKPKSKLSKNTLGYPYVNRMVNISLMEYALDQLDFFQIISKVELDVDQLDMCVSKVRDAVHLDEEFEWEDVVHRHYRHRFDNRNFENGLLK